MLTDTNTHTHKHGLARILTRRMLHPRPWGYHPTVPGFPPKTSSIEMVFTSVPKLTPENELASKAQNGGWNWWDQDLQPREFFLGGRTVVEMDFKKPLFLVFPIPHKLMASFPIVKALLKTLVFEGFLPEGPVGWPMVLSQGLSGSPCSSCAMAAAVAAGGWRLCAQKDQH